jgi:integrase
MQVRIVRMPYCYHDSVNGRYFVERRIPDDVAAILRLPKRAKKKLVFPRSVDHATANKLSITINAEWEGEWDALRPSSSAASPKMATIVATVVNRLTALPTPAKTTVVRQKKIVDSEEIIALWLKDRSAQRTVKPRAIRLKRTVIRQLCEHVGLKPLRMITVEGEKKPVPAYDMAAVSADDLQKYKESMTNGRGHEHFSHINALYNVAVDERRLTTATNPCADIKTPTKPRSAVWDPFTEREARSILLAARSAPPDVRWTQWLSCFLGTIVSEIADRKVSDFKLDEDSGSAPVGALSADCGIWIMHIEEGKTDYRPRKLPLHDALRREGFFDYLDLIRTQYGPDAPLFPNVVVNRDGSRARLVGHHCRNFLLRLKTPDGKSAIVGAKHANGWRKRYATQLESMKDLHPDRQRYMCGHSPADVHANYLRHPPRDTKPFIDQLIDPTITVA